MIRFIEKHPYYSILLFLIMASVFFFPGLNGGLRDWDEGVYAEVAKEMHQRNEWLTPYYDGEPFIDKPPLLMWCTMLSYRSFGVGIWQARLTTCIASFLLLVLTLFFTSKVISPTAGILAGLFLMGMPHFVKEAKLGHLEQIVSFFLTLSLMGFWYCQKRKYTALLCGITTGLAFLTKWIVGLFAPIAQFILIIAGIHRAILKNKWWWLGYALGACTALPWFIHHYLSFPEKFMDTYFGRMVVASVTEAVNDHTGPFYYYISVLARRARPWGLLFLPLMAYLGFRTVKKDSVGTFLFVWLSVFFAIFSFSTTKMHRYIVILYPVFAIGLAYAVQTIPLIRKYQHIVMLCVLLIVPSHLVFSNNFWTARYNQPLQLMLSELSQDIEQADTLYLYGYHATFKPTLLFFTHNTIRKTDSTDEILAALQQRKEMLVITQSPDDTDIHALIKTGACTAFKPAHKVDNLTVFFLKKP